MQVKYRVVGEEEKDSNSNWLNGWTAGIGAEHFLSEKLTIRAEYRYTDYRREKEDVPMYGSTYKQKYDNEQSVRISASYYFN
jgi:opacity protein-like surface antigen